MDVLVKTTFLIILVFSLINFLMSLSIYKTTKRDIYLRTSAFWLLLIVNFAVQSQAQGSEAAIILGYGFTIVPLNMLCYISLQFCNGRYPKVTFPGLAVMAFAATVAMMDSHLSFTAKAMPFATAAAVPLLYTVYIYAKNVRQATPLMWVHALILLLLAVHSFNFAIFRMDPDAQLWGWPVAYGLYQLLAAVIPGLVLDFYHRAEQERLRAIIQAKTSDLTRANDELYKAVQQKSYLFRMLTHDISNPVNTMNFVVESYAMDKVEKSEFLSMITGTLDRISTLITQVRQFDKVDSLKSQLKTERAGLLPYIRSVEDLFRDRLTKKDVRLVYNERELNNCFVDIDSGTFSNSVLPNIVSNAIKFSNQGGEISVGVKSVGYGSIVLTIRDQGIGMSSQMVDALFEFGSNSSRYGTANEKGTGFGVPILSKIIQAYGGTLKYSSREQTPDQSGFTEVEITLSGELRSAVQPRPIRTLAS